MIIRPDVDLTKDEVRELGAFSDVYIDMLFDAGQEVVKRKCSEYIQRDGVTIFDKVRNSIESDGRSQNDATWEVCK